MAPKAKKEGPALPKAKAKAKASKAKETELKGLHSHKKKDPHITHLPKAQDSEGSPNILGKAPPEKQV